MKRLNLYLPDLHYDWLEQQSEAQGVSAAELVRRAVEAWIKAQGVTQPVLFKHGYSAHSGLNWRNPGASAIAGSIKELQQVVTLLEQAMRATASRDTMAVFDAALAELHQKSRPVSPLDASPDPPQIDEDPT